MFQDQSLLKVSDCDQIVMSSPSKVTIQRVNNRAGVMNPLMMWHLFHCRWHRVSRVCFHWCVWEWGWRCQSEVFWWWDPMSQGWRWWSWPFWCWWCFFGGGIGCHGFGWKIWRPCATNSRRRQEELEQHARHWCCHALHSHLQESWEEVSINSWTVCTIRSFQFASPIAYHIILYFRNCLCWTRLATPLWNIFLPVRVAAVL